MRHRRSLLAVLFMLGLLPVLPHSPLALQTARADTATFTSSGGASVSHGPGSPYPSTITVAGLPRQVMHVSVTLTALNYYNPNATTGCDWGQLHVLLGAPDGQTAVVMSGVSRNSTSSPSDARTLTFD